MKDHILKDIVLSFCLPLQTSPERGDAGKSRTSTQLRAAQVCWLTCTRFILPNDASLNFLHAVRLEIDLGGAGMPSAERRAMIEIISDIRSVGLGLGAGRVWLIDVSEGNCVAGLRG